MIIQKITTDEIDSITKKAVQILKNDGLIVYPGKNAYLIGADILNLKALDKLYLAKKRPKHKQLAAIVSDIEMAKEYAKMTKDEEKLVESLMPGEIILVSKKKPIVPDRFGFEEFAFTIANKPIAKTILKEFGRPITASSCNISGDPTNYSLKTVEDEVTKYIDMLIDAGDFPENPDYTVVDIFDGVNIRREGPVTKEQIEEVLKN